MLADTIPEMKEFFMAHLRDARFAWNPGARTSAAVLYADFSGS